VTPEEYRVARHAQELRCEAETKGYGSETETFYGRGETGGHGREVPFTWRAVLAEEAGRRREEMAWQERQKYCPDGAPGLAWESLQQVRALPEATARYYAAWEVCEQLERELAQARALRVGALRQIRDETRLTQRELASQVGVSAAMVNRLLNA
jgi:hypothetical protein